MFLMKLCSMEVIVIDLWFIFTITEHTSCIIKIFSNINKMSGGSIHYCFIARDSEMIVFESVLAKELSASSQGQRSAFRREVKDKVAFME